MRYGNIWANYRKNGTRVGAYGAGGKGQALLNMLGLDVDSVELVIDDVIGNAGNYVPGTGIPVMSSTDIRSQGLSTILITAPTHVQEIVRKEADRVAAGTQFLATTPGFHVVPV